MFKSKWMRFLPFLPILVLLLVVNIYGDAGNKFHSPADAMADALVNGYPAYVASGNLNERELRYRYICRMPDDIECSIFGSSTVLCVKSTDIGVGKFVNLGNSAGRLEDALSCLGAIKFLGKHKHIQRIIFSPSEYWFNRKRIDSDYDKTLMPYVDYMLDTIKGKNTEDRQIPTPEFNASIFSSNLLFSLSYFQANVKYILGSNMLQTARSGIVEKDKYEGKYYMPDGSLVYEKKTTMRDEINVIHFAGEFVKDRKVLEAYTEHLDSENSKIFDKLVEYLTAQGIRVDIFLVPLPPALWDRINPTQYPFFPELEEYLINTADKYSLRVIGSFNPYKVDITNSDFYDARHIRSESISKYFNLKD